MRIDCPSCGAGYDLAPDQVPPGRGVRCARCGNVWAPVALVDAAPPIPLPPDPEFERVSELMREPEVEREPAAGPEPAFAPMATDAPKSVAVAGETPELTAEHPDSPAQAALDVGVDRPSAAASQDGGPTRLGAQRQGMRKGHVPPWGGWLATALVLAALGWGLVTYRATVMAGWPPSTRAYGWVGLAPRTR